MHHKKNTNGGNVRQANIIHLFLLVGILVLIISYFYFQNATSLWLAGTAFVLVHLAVGGGLLYAGRGMVRRFFNKLHHQPQAKGSTGQAMQTEGLTLHAPRFYDVLSGLIFFGTQRKYLNAILGLANIQRDEKVIDVACGTGTFAIASKSRTRSATIHGLDASPEMLARARQKAAHAGVDVSFHHGMVENIDFPDQTFDLVTSAFMMHHLPGEALKAQAVTEIYRVLKPGGRVLLVDFEPPKKGMAKVFLNALLGHNGMMRIDNSELPGLLEKAGFELRGCGPAGHPLATYAEGRKG